MAASSSSSSSSSSSYDVFLSFRGTDTRNNFISHLFAKLKDQDYNVFHDTTLERGESVSSGLLQAIEGSKLSIVVFSKNYADSRWCLDELVKIVECHHRSPHPQIVLPVFYDVQPSDVRKQDDQYAAAFVNHKKNRDVQQVKDWEAALNEVGNLSGLTTPMDFVKKIVEQVASRLDQPYLHVADHPVGIEYHVKKLNGFLRSKTNDIRIIAICGLGGIGKTTIAIALFNEHCKLFDGSCFLADVRATAARPDDVGMVILQERLMATIIKENLPKIHNCHHGIEVIKQRLRGRRVLIVLDDVDNVGQLKKLAINRQWLRQGSIIIITTRDRSCVSSLYVEFYEPGPLGPNNSLELFGWHAFGDSFPNAYYNAVSHEVVKYTGGVPLVLEMLGAYMRNFGTIEEWQQALEKLRIIPHDGVQAKLKLSFDSLRHEEKKLFLDIACFFVGIDKELMLQVLNEKAPQYYPKFEFKVLCNRFLVKIDDFGKLSMHDMVRDMGREIVRQESLDDPGRRSRLCHRHDILSVLKDSSGTNAIESIFLEVSNLYEEPVQMKAFANMTKLRMVHFSSLNVHGTYSNIKFFEKLKWLGWYGFHFTCLPSNLNMRNLVVLDLQNSRLKQLWRGIKSLDKLIFLNVSDSHFLTSTPDFSGVVNLEKLLLRNCTNLREIHHSIGCLRKLIVLDLTNCKNLTKVPLSFFQLKSFEDVNFSGVVNLEKLLLRNCTNLREIHHSTGCLPKLIVLDLTNCKNLTKVPLSFFQLKSLKDVNFSGCSKLFESTQFETSVSLKPQPKNLEPTFLLQTYLQGQNCLTKLNLYGCNLSCLPAAIWNLTSLIDLRLGGNKFASLPTSIKYLQCLETLDLSDSHFLTSTPDFSGVVNLRKLFVRNCTNLGEIHHSITCLHNLIFLDLTNCKSLFSSVVKLKYLKDANLFDFFKHGATTQSEASFSFLWKLQPKSLEPTFLLQSYLQGQNCLTKLCLNDRNLSCLPTAIGNLASLVDLQLRGNKFASLPASIKYLQHLRWLDVEACVDLMSIQDLPSGIKYLKAQNCPLLETIEVASDSSGQINLDVSRNTKLVDNIFTNKVHVLSKFNMIVNEIDMGEIPYWFSYQGVGLFISFVVPRHTNRRVKGWIVVVSVYSNFIVGNVYNKTKDMHSDFAYFIPSKALWMGYVELSKHGIVADGDDEIEIVFMAEGVESGKCGLCLVYDDEDEVGNYEQITPIQYSPRLVNYEDNSDDDFDGSINPIDLYVNPVMRARIKPMLDDLRHLDGDIVFMLLKEIVFKRSSGEHPEIYHTIANAFYNQVCPHGDLYLILQFLNIFED